MADDINSSASFGQSKNDSEELPIIVAQRFLNIFRQLHIFSDERREAFNKMLLELPPEVKSIFRACRAAPRCRNIWKIWSKKQRA